MVCLLKKFSDEYIILGTSLVVQWLRLCISPAGSVGSVAGRGTKISHATWHSKKKKKQSVHKFLQK